MNEMFFIKLDVTVKMNETGEIINFDCDGSVVTEAGNHFFALAEMHQLLKETYNNNRSTLIQATALSVSTL